MDERKGTAVEALLEQLIAQGPNDIAGVFARAFELAMELERERFLRAGRYERTPERQGYANGYKPKRVDTPAGSVTVQVPKTAGHGDTPFYPQSLERGRRSVRAVMLAVAEMYIKGVSTRDVEAVMAEFGIESLSSSQVSRATKLLDEELQAWRDRPLGEVSYLFLDARYEKMRHGGVVRDVAVLSAIGIGPDERRRILGVSVALSEAETALADLVAGYRENAPKLASWLEENVPEGLAVFTLPEHHRKRLRTSNPIERSVQQELKRRTVKIRVFPSEDALLRLVSAVLVEIDEKWASDTKAYIKWECQDA